MDRPIKISNRVGVFNGGMELRISKVLERDLGDYTCIARNGVSGGRIHHTTKVSSNLYLTLRITLQWNPFIYRVYICLSKRKYTL